MNSLALLKRALLATLGVIAILGIARPAAAAPYYFYTITAAPNWGFGNPQLPSGWSAQTALVAGPPASAEDYVSLSLQGYPGYWYSYDTFLGEANGFVGADVSVPTAQWVTPAAYYWTGGPAGGGALAFFNSFNPFTGVYYANMMIVLDPFSCSASVCLSDFETDLGSTSGLLTPSLVTLDGNGDPQGITLPNDDEDASVEPDPLGTNYFASGSQFLTPEGPTATYLLLGFFVFGAGILFRRPGAIPLIR
ncbi:MAG: hypothetical protein ABSC77_08555 [Terracidiphilus sp.]|jgi:hypothetical protein